MTSELKPLAGMHPCPPASGGGKRHRSRVYADGRQHYCERCGEKIDATTFSNIPETYVTTHDAGDYNKPRTVPDVPELVRYDIVNPDQYRRVMAKVPLGDYALHSQATEIIAAKDAEIKRLKDLIDGDGCADSDKIDALFRRAETAEAKVEEPKERIVAAAIYAGATISLPPPARHHTILHTMSMIMEIDAIEHGINQGFLTSTGRYVNRVEGWQIAQQAGQILRNTAGRPELYSEDMW